MQLPTFKVLLQDGDDQQSEHEVTILHGDQLRAELEAPKHGLNDMGAAPMHFTTLWIWAALQRTHAIDPQPFGEFKPRVLALEAVDDEEVDPTQLGAGTS